MSEKSTIRWTNIRWTFDDCSTIEDKIKKVEDNFDYFVRKTLYPQTITKYANWFEGLGPEINYTCTGVTPGKPQSYYNVESEVSEFAFTLTGACSKVKRFKKSLGKFVDFMFIFLADFMTEDEFNRLVGDNPKLTYDTATFRTVPLESATLSEGFIMEAKTTALKSEKYYIGEADLITRSIGKNGKTILADYRHIIKAVYFFNICGLAYNNETTVAMDRTAISQHCFNVLYDQRLLSDDVHHFWSYYFLFLSKGLETQVPPKELKVYFKLWERKSPDSLDVPGRDFEKDYYKTGEEIAKYRKVYYHILNTTFKRLFPSISRFYPYNQSSKKRASEVLAEYEEEAEDNDDGETKRLSKFKKIEMAKFPESKKQKKEEPKTVSVEKNINDMKYPFQKLDNSIPPPGHQGIWLNDGIRTVGTKGNGLFGTELLDGNGNKQTFSDAAKGVLGSLQFEII